HRTLRGDDGGGERAHPRLSLPPPGPAGVHLPLPLAAGLARVLGQPLRPAQRRQRLRRPPPPHAPHHPGRRRAGRRDVTLPPARPRVYFPFARLALCADCEVCFEIGLEACPACGGRTWSPLSRLIGQASDGAIVRAVRAVVAETRGGAATRGDAHHLVIVSRDQPKLFDMLRRELHASETVTVILDRRGGRPQPALARMNLRWRNVDRQIAALGWAIVRSDLITAKR